jgi:hypothetical protein
VRRDLLQILAGVPRVRGGDPLAGVEVAGAVPQREGGLGAADVDSEQERDGCLRAFEASRGLFGAET